MKKTILFFYSIIASNILLAQYNDGNPKPVQFQAGINVASFVKQFINFSGTNNNLITTPYACNGKVLYRLRKNDALIGLRLGMGYTNTETESITPSFESSSVNETFDGRIGLEYQKELNKRWVTYVGFDYISQSASNINKSNFLQTQNPVKSTTNVNTVMDGGGFVLGIQFNINKYITLSTEASYYYSDSFSKTVNTSSNQNNQQDPLYNKSKNTRLVLPNLINFNIIF
ncbi:MAG: hypothetical protein JHD28_07210 [Bacteroidia bacterium]|nr:hypothetical protein [Bacteroidia bacterium]